MCLSRVALKTKKFSRRVYAFWQQSLQSNVIFAHDEETKMKTQLLKAVSFTCAVLVAIPLTLVDAAEGLDSDAISRAAGTSGTR